MKRHYNSIACLLLGPLLFLCPVDLAAQEHAVASVAKGSTTWLKTFDDGWTTLTLPSAACTQRYKLNTNLAIAVSQRPYWMSAVTEASGDHGTLADVVVMTIKANTSSKVRTGSMVLKSKDGQTITIGINQMSANLETLAANKKKVNFYGDKLEDSLEVVSNAAYTVVVPDWIKMENLGGDKYRFTTERLYDSSLRSGTIKFLNAGGTVLATVLANEYYATSDWYEKPCFAVMSDVHFGDLDNIGWSNRMPRALQNINGHDPKVRQVFVVGDLANQGREEEYKNVVSYYNKYLDSGIERIFIRGNHDNIQSQSYQYFASVIQQPYNRYIGIQGYPFISIGSTSTDYRGDNCYDAATISFLKASLADAADKFPDKPIFVFQHVLPKNTVIGSYESDYNAYGSYLDEIFSNYPQVIDISAHTHMGITDPHQIYQKSYTALNDGSHKNDSNPTHFPGYYNVGAEDYEDYGCVTEGYVIHIDKEDKVIVERWNTAINEHYSPDWVIAPPFDGTNFTYKNRTGGESPWWPTGAVLQLSNQTATSAYVTFPQAQDDEDVYRYYIDVVNSSGTKVRSSIKQFSLLNRGSRRPETLTINLTDLPSDTQLTCKVTGYDAYDQTTKTLTATFTLASE